MKKLPLLLPVLLIAVLPLRAADLELVGFHLGSEYFILTEEIDTSDFAARKCIFVFRASFNDRAVSRIDPKSIELRVVPEGSDTGITYRAEEIAAFVTDRLNDSTILLQLGFPYNLTALGTRFQIEGSVSFFMEEEEKRSRAIEIPLTAGSRIPLEGLDLLISKVEIPPGEEESFAVTFRHESESEENTFAAQFYDGRMQEIRSRQSNSILDTIHESTFVIPRPDGRLFAIFSYVGPSDIERVEFVLNSTLSAVATSETGSR